MIAFILSIEEMSFDWGEKIARKWERENPEKKWVGVILKKVKISRGKSNSIVVGI